MAKRISIINFKGGVGKSTLAFHLATGLERHHDARVLLIDVDHQSSLSILCLGASRWEASVRDSKTVNEVFQHFTVLGAALPGDEILIRSAVRRPPGYVDQIYPNLDLVPASLALDDTEINLAASHTGDPIASEWFKRTLLCRWLDATDADERYDYIIVDCPPATKIVSQNAIAMSHGYIVPVMPEAVMERGAPHLAELIKDGIDRRLRSLAPEGAPTSTYVQETRLVGLVVARIQTHPTAYSGYINDHTQHLNDLKRRWGNDLITPYIVHGAGVPESLTAGLPVYDREDTQNVEHMGFVKLFKELVTNVKGRVDQL